MPRSDSKPRDHGHPTGQRVDIHSVTYVKLLVGFSHRELIAFAKMYPLITGPGEARDVVLSWSWLREDGLEAAALGRDFCSRLCSVLCLTPSPVNPISATEPPTCFVPTVVRTLDLKAGQGHSLRRRCGGRGLQGMGCSAPFWGVARMFSCSFVFP